MLKILLTVDTENPQTDYRNGRVAENIVDPILDGESYGVTKLAKIFENHDALGTFFITTSEKYIFGESFYKNISFELHNQGHEIAIHSHPEWMLNDGRIHMWELNLEEQIEKLAEMKKDITSWTGIPPVSHRAGAYGINKDTLLALAQLNIPIDSSMFANHENCKVKYTHNKVIKSHNILEVPVTGFYKTQRLSLWGLNIKMRTMYVKTDIETCRLDELIWFADYAVENSLEIMNVFMHSYSLINLASLPEIKPNDNEVKLNSFLDYINNNRNSKYMTVRDYKATLGSEIRSVTGMVAEQVPYIYEDIPLKSIIKKCFRKFLRLVTK